MYTHITYIWVKTSSLTGRLWVTTLQWRYTWPSLRLKSRISRLFVQNFVQTKDPSMDFPHKRTMRQEKAPWHDVILVLKPLTYLQVPGRVQDPWTLSHPGLQIAAIKCRVLDSTSSVTNNRTLVENKTISDFHLSNIKASHVDCKWVPKRVAVAYTSIIGGWCAAMPESYTSS